MSQEAAKEMLPFAAHLERQGQEPKLVLWAHNSMECDGKGPTSLESKLNLKSGFASRPRPLSFHIGDARATDMSWRRNELNIGQLTREHFGKDATFNIGFTTHTGQALIHPPGGR
eukprot:1160630-Pelagomonas_calceolata.AAC.1